MTFNKKWPHHQLLLCHEHKTLSFSILKFSSLHHLHGRLRTDRNVKDESLSEFPGFDVSRDMMDEIMQIIHSFFPTSPRKIESIIHRSHSPCTSIEAAAWRALSKRIDIERLLIFRHSEPTPKQVKATKMMKCIAFLVSGEHRYLQKDIRKCNSNTSTYQNRILNNMGVSSEPCNYWSFMLLRLGPVSNSIEDSP